MYVSKYVLVVDYMLFAKIEFCLEFGNDESVERGGEKREKYKKSS